VPWISITSLGLDYPERRHRQDQHRGRGRRCRLCPPKKICEEYLTGQYDIEIVDLLQTPALAQGDQILAIPTLV